MWGAPGDVLIHNSHVGPWAVCAILAATGRRTQRCDGTVGWISETKKHVITLT